jgi:hypothetical protein
LLYELDAANIPQVSQEAVDIINAIGAGIIDPATFNPTSVLPSNITTKPQDIMKLFELRDAPPGFEDIQIPVPGQGSEYGPEYYDEEFADYGEEKKDEYDPFSDPTYVHPTDGSLQQELAW